MKTPARKVLGIYPSEYINTSFLGNFPTIPLFVFDFSKLYHLYNFNFKLFWYNISTTRFIYILFFDVIFINIILKSKHDALFLI